MKYGSSNKILRYKCSKKDSSSYLETTEEKTKAYLSTIFFLVEDVLTRKIRQKSRIGNKERNLQSAWGSRHHWTCISNWEQRFIFTWNYTNTKCFWPKFGKKSCREKLSDFLSTTLCFCLRRSSTKHFYRCLSSGLRWRRLEKNWKFLNRR